MITNHPQPHEVYKHYKRGTLYRILCVATREADLVPCVVCESLHPEAEHRFWTRSIEDFCADVILDDGTIIKQFVLLDTAAA